MFTSGYPLHLCFKHRRKATGIQVQPASLLVISYRLELAVHGLREVAPLE